MKWLKLRASWRIGLLFCHVVAMFVTSWRFPLLLLSVLSQLSGSDRVGGVCRPHAPLPTRCFSLLTCRNLLTQHQNDIRTLVVRMKIVRQWQPTVANHRYEIRSMYSYSRVSKLSCFVVMIHIPLRFEGFNNGTLWGEECGAPERGRGQQRGFLRCRRHLALLFKPLKLS